jgi:hypothetical protein
MNIEVLGAVFGKRFFGLLVCIPCLTVGYFFGDPAIFPSFATSLGLLYGAFVGGQSFTDAKGA